MRTVLIFFLLALSTIAGAQVKIYVHLDTSIKSTFTGRLFVLTQNDTSKQVSDQPDFANPQSFFAKNVRNWKGSEVQLFTGTEEFTNKKLPQLSPGYYKAAAIIDANEEERAFNFSPGNAYSRKDAIFRVDSSGRGEAHIYINTLVTERPFRESDRVKEMKVRSSLLSDFHKKDVFVKAGILLPVGYDSLQLRDLPVVFVIPGWGGTHYDVRSGGSKARYGFDMGKNKVYVYLNPETQTRWGLHSFVDSRVNGPWGKALVEEVIPHLQQKYRISKSAQNYFLTGQSSGGYGALWLQINYPAAFNGVWAASPDPVDFNDFIGIDLYSDPNFYVDAAGKERPIFIINGKPMTTLREFLRHDEFFGDGHQIQAFEAAFGKAGKDGRPRQLFDRKTGKVNKSVLNDWKDYDLGLYLRNNWTRLQAQLDNKIHIYAGSEDNFLLQGAVKKFGEKAASVNASVVCEIIPGANHWTVWTKEFTEKIQKAMDSRIVGN